MTRNELNPQDRFYLPTLGERLRLMGWRNVLWLPPLLILLMGGGLLAYGFSSLLSLIWWWKLIVFAFGIPLAAALRASSVALSKRADPFCIHCGYSLTGLPVAPGERFICPECGAEVDAVESQDYSRDPHWYIQRRKLAHPVHQPFEAGEVREENPDRI